MRYHYQFRPREIEPPEYASTWDIPESLLRLASRVNYEPLYRRLRDGVPVLVFAPVVPQFKMTRLTVGWRGPDPVYKYGTRRDPSRDVVGTFEELEATFRGMLSRELEPSFANDRAAVRALARGIRAGAIRRSAVVKVVNRMARSQKIHRTVVLSELSRLNLLDTRALRV